ncbi:MAG: hypothetical protein KA957_03535 [Syntrophaceae bacterium]|nr:hypothetical protein [Syntrophaceae bacterium]
MKVFANILALYAQICGGSINNTPIGNVTPAPAAFSSLSIPAGTPVNAVAATGTLTADANPSPAAQASGILTSNESLVADGATVTIGTTVYTFKTALSEPAVAYEVLIGENYSAQLANLAAAINGGTGAGVTYGTGTAAHPDVQSSAPFNAAITITAKVAGDAGNLIAKDTDSGNLDWDGAGDYLTGGLDTETVTIGAKTYAFVAALTPAEGEVLIGATLEATLTNLKNAINHTGTPDTDYSCAEAHPSVSATADATHLVATAKVKGAAGNAIATSDAEAGEETHMAWAAETLEYGIDGTAAPARAICADNSYIYYCIAANTVADANWRQISIGTVY